MSHRLPSTDWELAGRPGYSNNFRRKVMVFTQAPIRPKPLIVAVAQLSLHTENLAIEVRFTYS